MLECCEVDWSDWPHIDCEFEWVLWYLQTIVISIVIKVVNVVKVIKVVKVVTDDDLVEYDNHPKLTHFHQLRC